MADTYTSALKARKIEPGTRSNTWGGTLNADALDIFDASITGATTIDLLSATTYTLAALANGTLGESHFFGLIFIGTPASAVTITVPASVTYKTFLVYNNTGQSLTIKYAATGGVVIKNGARQEVWCDGVTVYAVSFGLGTDNTITGSNTISSTAPRLQFNETDGAADNKRWDFIVSGEQFVWRTVNDADSVNANICIVQRTGTTVDSVVFPTTTAGSFLVGTSTAIAPNGVMSVVAPTSVVALSLKGVTAAQTPLSLWNATIAEDSYFIEFGTEAGFSARGSITYNRGGGLTAYNTTSDARLKTNIVEAPPASDIINRVRVRSFDWRDERRPP